MPDIDSRTDRERAHEGRFSAQPSVKQIISGREAAMLAVLHRIVVEVMDYPPTRPDSSRSYLPAQFVKAAQEVLDLYNAFVPTGKVPA